MINRQNLAGFILATAALFPLTLSAQDDTTLKPNDKIVITVFGEDKLSTETTIAESGTVEMPLVGSVSLGGKTIKEATAEITQKLAQGFVVDPKVTLIRTGSSMAQAMVLGHVRKPGAIDVPGGELDLLAAIALAGGFDEHSNSNSVSIRRKVDGKDKVFRVDARKLATDDTATPFSVQPADIVTVPERLMGSVTVMGEVARPGLVEVAAGESIDILTALAMAGGLSEKANTSDILVRRVENGRNKVHRINTAELLNNPHADSFRVQPGDVVTAPTHVAETLTVMGEVNKPGLIPLPQDKQLTILDAIASAGGYTAIANPKKITLRRNVDGHDRIILINGKRLASDGDADPVFLEANDVIIVAESFF